MKIAFVNGLLIDGNGGEPVKDSLVLIEGKRSYMPGRKKTLTGTMKCGTLPEKPLCRV